MRPDVAIVTARPETISEDYERLLSLADLPPLTGDEAPAVIAAAWSRWLPGRTVPAWQADGVLGRIAKRGDPEPSVIHAVDAGGGRCAKPDARLGDVLAGAGARWADETAWEPRPVRVRTPLPALARALPEGFFVPAGLRERPLVGLGGVALGPGWLVEGAVALLARLLASRTRRDRRVPADEVRAEVAGLAAELAPQAGYVLDGTVWNVAVGGGEAPVVRNILVAGRDPVAVDSVLAHLAGLTPSRVPWLRICNERGFGVSDPARVRVVGNRELLDLDFGIPVSTFAARRNRLAAWLRRVAPRAAGATAAGPWTGLHTNWSPQREAGVAP